MDDLKVLVETQPGVAASSSAAQAAAKQLQHDIKAYLGSSVEIDLRDSGSVERSVGKAKRVVDLRPK